MQGGGRWHRGGHRSRQKGGKRWAALWLQVHGRRLGIGKGGKRTVKRTGTYMAVKKGVLAAAEYAMAEGGDGMAPHP